MSISPADIKSWSEAAAAALATLKVAKDLLPAGKKKQDAEKAIEAAERDLQVAHASAAKELGFELCRRHWPPGIMVMDDRDIYVCRDCGKADPEVGEKSEVLTSGTLASDVSDEELRVLRFIDQARDCLESDEVSRAVGIPPPRVAYLLEKLTGSGHLHDSVTDPPRYKIQQKGRAVVHG
jgi:hypothetical protein